MLFANAFAKTRVLGRRAQGEIDRLGFPEAVVPCDLCGKRIVPPNGLPPPLDEPFLRDVHKEVHDLLARLSGTRGQDRTELTPCGKMTILIVYFYL